MLASTIQQVLGRLLVRRGHCGRQRQVLVRRGHRGGQRHWEGGWEGGEGSTCLKLLDVVAQLGRGLGEDVQLGDGEVEEEEEEYSGVHIYWWKSILVYTYNGGRV